MKKIMLATATALALTLPMSVHAGELKQEMEAPSQLVLAGEEYMMCAGDQLQITVYGHEDLSSKPGTNFTPYVVRPDGHLTMPLIGDIDVRNKSVNTVTQEIRNRLSEYIIDPKVTINIVKLGATRVYVLGEVKRPGLYELEKSHNLLDAIGKAEGFTEMAAKKKVFVIRRGATKPLMTVNLNNFLTKGDINQNVQLNEGDTVYLKSNGKINFVKDIAPFLSAAYMISEIKENEEK